MSDIDRRALGRIGEDAAALYLQNKGYTVTARNVRIGHSEIDLICENDEYVVFAEVKTRRQKPDMQSAFGSPASAVDSKKQSALIRGAEGYLLSHPGEKFTRIDIIEVYVSDSDVFTVTEIRHFENAVRKNGKFSKNPHTRRFHNEAD